MTLAFRAALVFCALLCTLLTPCSSRADADFNLDGKSDLLWVNQNDGTLVNFNLNSDRLIGGGPFSLRAPAGWKIVDTPDLNGDGKTDLLWQNETTGNVAYWLMNGTTRVFLGDIAPAVPAVWRLVCAPDLNGDGIPDLLWQNRQTGQVIYWIMGGLNSATRVSLGDFTLNPGVNWRLVGTADFNGDGKADLLWQSKVTGEIVVWFLNGTVRTGSVSLSIPAPANWNVVGTTDFNKDGKPDLVFQNQVTGDAAYWLMNGTVRVSMGDLLPANGPDWKLAGMGSGPNAASVTRLSPLENADLYGIVRLRIKNLNNPIASVSVRVGSAISAAAATAYTDRFAPSDGLGGALDFRIPTGLTSGSTSVIVTLNGVDLPPYTVSVPTANPFATFTMASGTKFVVQLRSDKAPNTVANFVGLAMGTITWTPTYATNTGYKTAGPAQSTPLYDGVKFHRVTNLDGNAPATKIVQGGDPITKQTSPPADWQAGTGNPGFFINFETNDLTHVDGAIAMARSQSLNSAGSQFYLCDGPQHFLDGSYAVFGLTVEGLERVRMLQQNEAIASVRISGKLALP